MFIAITSKKQIKKLNRSIKRCAKALEQIARNTRRPPPQPGTVTLIVTGESDMALQYKLTLPTPTVSDVTTRKLTVNGNTTEHAVAVVEVEGFEGEQGAEVAGTLVDVDDAGNESVPSAFTFTLTDTFAPPEPGAVGIVVTGET
jgi:hypothetical protein